jgi:hypothetical protein
MKRDETALKMICNQWVGSSNLSSGTTYQEYSELLNQTLFSILFRLFDILVPT